MSSLLSDLRIASSRKAKHNKKRSSIVSEDFHWSLQRNSPDQKRYLAKVPDGLRDAANKFNVSILPEDILPWIEAHEGHCPLYINPNSIAGLTIRNQKRFQGKDIDDIKRTVEESTTTHRFFAPSPRFNNLNLSATTEYNYEESINTFWRFCAMLGNYHDMLLLLPAPSGKAHYPAVMRETLFLFVHHAFDKPREPLLDRSGRPVVDVFNREVLCEGRVQNSNWLSSLFAAIKIIHSRNDYTGDYRDPCPDCFKLLSPLPGRFPCANCSANNQEIRDRAKGNPVPNFETTALKKWMVQQLKDRGYVPDSKSALLPGDFDKIHQYLESNNYSPHLVNKWLVILFSSLYGTRDQCSRHSQVDAILKHNDLFVVYENRIDRLFLSIRDKGETEDSIYELYFEDHYPHRCFLRTFLCFAHVTGLQEGYLFPNTDKIKPAMIDARNNRVFQSMYPMTDDEYSGFLDKLCKEVLHNGHMLNLGGHTGRMTLYLILCLQGAVPDQARVQSRHKDMNMCMKYWKDASTVLNMIQEHPQLRRYAQVPPLRLSRVEGNGTASVGRLGTLLPGTISVDSLQQLCKIFVEKMLHVSPDHPQYHDLSFLLRKSYHQRLSTRAPENHFESYVSTLPSPLKEGVMANFRVYLDQNGASLKGLQDRKALQEQVTRMEGELYRARQQVLRLRAQLVHSPPSISSAIPPPQAPSPEQQQQQQQQQQPPTPPLDHLPVNQISGMLVLDTTGSRNGHPKKTKYKIDTSRVTELIKTSRENGALDVRAASIHQYVLLVKEVAMLSSTQPGRGNIVDRFEDGKKHISTASFVSRFLWPFCKCYFGCHNEDFDAFYKDCGHALGNQSNFKDNNPCRLCKNST
jgi:hypothetical protein